MDSKLKRRTILAVFSAMVLIFAFMAYVNCETIERRLGVPVTGQTAPAETQTVTEQNRQSNGEKTIFGTQVGNNLAAFQYDETFFDPKLSAAEKLLLENNSNRLSLVVTSVEKDLRVQVVNAGGFLITDQSLLVTLSDNQDGNSLGEYKDLDQDGVIYIGDLKAGDYYVTLKPVAGYEVPENPTKILVKDKVEYVVIDDIDLLILTEDQVNAAAEDTGENGATEDADKSEMTDIRSENGIFGIDVSKYQGDIDWEKVRDAGVQFAIIRCGYRGSQTGCLVEDPFFAQNMRGAAEAGIPVGVYFFTQATNEVEAVEEASMVVTLCERYQLDYPVYIDTEGAGGNGRADALDAETRTTVCEAFCSTLRNAGFGAGVYASRNWLNNNLYADRLSSFETWLAEYREIPEYEGYYTMWQYTSKGSIDGIEGNVDLDISYLQPEDTEQEAVD
ncbi:MAG: glycoside hydrolase family 25 protein [Lachnospiraceae bacterium]|nr:glycoside hydrolase family 25 protein [Lachnospiraceae bacterium]